MPQVFIKNVSKCFTTALLVVTVSRIDSKNMLVQDNCDYINSVSHYFSTVEGKFAVSMGEKIMT